MLQLQYLRTYNKFHRKKKKQYIIYIIYIISYTYILIYKYEHLSTVCIYIIYTCTYSYKYTYIFVGKLFQRPPLPQCRWLSSPASLIPAWSEASEEAFWAISQVVVLSNRSWKNMLIKWKSCPNRAEKIFQNHHLVSDVSKLDDL